MFGLRRPLLGEDSIEPVDVLGLDVLDILRYVRAIVIKKGDGPGSSRKETHCVPDKGAHRREAQKPRDVRNDAGGGLRRACRHRLRL